jgi:hypothetical protein
MKVHKMLSRAARASVVPAVAALAVAGSPRAAAADDAASIVARARGQVEGGSYAEAMKTLRSLQAKTMPPALVVEAALLETTAALVTSGAAAGESACAKAVVAAAYDPEVARDQSPKVRGACRLAAAKERAKRLERDAITFDELVIERPEVAWQPARISARVSSLPGWLHVVARVTSSALEGAFDLSLTPSVEGPLRGTLDPAWTRPRAEIKVDLVPQDKYGDLGPAVKSTTFVVPAAEAIVVLGNVPASSVTTIDGVETNLAPGGWAAVSPGQHVVALTLSDGSFASAQVGVKRGGVARVALSPQKPPVSRTAAWVATGTSVALLAVGGVLLLNAEIRRTEIEDLAAQREPGTDLPANEYEDIKARDDERRKFQTVGSALLIGGGAVGAGALALWLWPNSVEASKRGRGITPMFGAGQVGFAGRF